MFVRSVAIVAILLVVAQCGDSPDSTTAPTSVAGTIIVDTTSSGSSSSIAPTATVVETTSTVVEATPTTVQVTTTTLPEPTTTTVAVPVIDPNCPTTPHAAVIDRDRQRVYLCDNGVAQPEFVVTTAIGQPDPGTYPVYAKSMHASSRMGGHFSTMTHFVAFTHGEETGARVAFHTVPILRNGEYVQPLASVGTQLHFGDTSGCIRVLPEQGPVIWDWLQRGDEVRVIT
ncbi:MAG: L,D-transpeptidase [Ilumatobacteraceae bacterium]|nr:L,D-transpeptidase [Ilumatobacteraceae bacterium]